MKIIRFLNNNYKAIIKNGLIFVVAIVAYMVARKEGTAQRGYEAIGSEIFIPLLIIFAEDIWEMIKEPFKMLKERN